MAVVLIIVKLYAWRVTGSISLQAALMDSVLDAFASVINLFAVRHSLKPADREHRFGHGKIEALAGLGQAFFIVISGFFILIEAFKSFGASRPMAGLSASVGIIVFSILVTMALVRYQKFVVAQTGSTAIAADAVHYQSDMIINVSVLFSLALSGWLHMAWVDPLIGSGIAFYIMWTAFKVLKASLDILMDRELPDDVRAKIKQIVCAHPEVNGLHDLRTRSTGVQTFFQLHLELDPALSLSQAHRISLEVEELIRQEFPAAEAIIHQDIHPDTPHQNKRYMR